MSVKEQIAEKLERAFSQYGFAEPSVSKLQKASGVSLRTLYKYYPSKEEMIVAALEHRHQRYMSLMEKDLPAKALEGVLHVVCQLEYWMTTHAPHGCMSTLAVASFPDNGLIASVVNEHKQAVQTFLSELVGDENKGQQLFVIHEGISGSWPVMGTQAIDVAKQMMTSLVEVQQ
ncbi:TetR/AcrR family transcriptional regulator [Vibrio sp. TBV020]|uniref:TetR/AcrR family transcriptional regulator n=1 Tax=Vibrio sp. TBV020 TaxID=3137398 RepID=UPI0038CD9D91